MGQGGVDVIIRDPALSTRFPYKIECKSQKSGFSAIYKAYEQCENHEGLEEPLVILKQDRCKPLAVVDAEYFLNMHRT